MVRFYMVRMLRLTLVVALLFTFSCDDSNTSDTREDIDRLRVKHLELSNAEGKTVLVLTAEINPHGTPLLIVRDPRGAVLKTIEIESAK